MKTRNTLLALCLLFTLNTSAQDWGIGTKWVYYQQDFIPDGIDEYWMFEFVADTMISFENFLTLQIYYLEQLPTGLAVSPLGKKYLRKDGNKVWVYEPTTAQSILLYDFDLAVGDSTMIYANAYNPPDETIQIGVSSKSSEVIDGILWDYQYVYTFDHNCEYYMEGRNIKGVGNYYYLFPVYYCADPQTGGALICFDNGTVRYPSSSTNCDFLLTAIDTPERKTAYAYPNPTAGQVYLDQTEFEKWELWTYRGEKLLAGNEPAIDMQNLADGIYLLVVFDREGRTAFQKISKVR